MSSSEWDAMVQAMNALGNNDVTGFRRGLYRAVALINAYERAKPGEIVEYRGRGEFAVLEACARLATSRRVAASKPPSRWKFWRLA